MRSVVLKVGSFVLDGVRHTFLVSVLFLPIAKKTLNKEDAHIMFRFSKRMFLYILVALIALIIAPHPMPSFADSGSGIACAATPNAFGGQGFSFSGQGFSFSGQGFSFSGQGFSFSGQGFSFSGQGIDPEQVIQDILNNLITPDWFAQFFPTLSDGAAYNSRQSALLV